MSIWQPPETLAARKGFVQGCGCGTPPVRWCPGPPQADQRPKAKAQEGSWRAGVKGIAARCRRVSQAPLSSRVRNPEARCRSCRSEVLAPSQPFPLVCAEGGWRWRLAVSRRQKQALQPRCLFRATQPHQSSPISARPPPEPSTRTQEHTTAPTFSGRLPGSDYGEPSFGSSLAPATRDKPWLDHHGDADGSKKTCKKNILYGTPHIPSCRQLTTA